jgi:hypothetical protein
MVLLVVLLVVLYVDLLASCVVGEAAVVDDAGGYVYASLHPW